MHSGMNFRSDSVVIPDPNFLNFGVAPVNATEKLGYVSVTTTRVIKPRISSDWRQQGNDIEEATVDRVIEIKSNSDYILKVSLKL